MAIPLTPKLMRMKGTDDAAPRCVALDGEIGCQVGCRIYDHRPSPCHEFNPWAALPIRPVIVRVCAMGCGRCQSCKSRLNQFEQVGVGRFKLG